MRMIRRFFLQVMIAMTLSALELGGVRGIPVRQAIVRVIPPEPIYPPRYLPVRRRPLYAEFEGDARGESDVTSRFN